jgi:CBS domain-containing protein
MSELRVKDIMAEAFSVDKSAALSYAMDMMRRHGVKYLLVTKDNSLVGALTQRAIARALGSRRKSNLPASALHVATVIEDNFAVISPGDDVGSAVRLLRTVDILAVCNGKLVGWITPKEVLPVLKPDGCAGDIMKEPIITSPSERVAHVWRRMLDEDIGRMPVIENSQLVGIITESDIARAMEAFRHLVPGHQQDSRIRNLVVGDVMSVNVKFVLTNTPVSEVIGLMLKEDICGVPVLNDRDELVGIITRRDVIRVEKFN